MPYIKIDKKTYRGLCNVLKLTHKKQSSFIKKALRTYIEDTFDAAEVEAEQGVDND